MAPKPVSVPSNRQCYFCHILLVRSEFKDSKGGGHMASFIGKSVKEFVPSPFFGNHDIST